MLNIFLLTVLVLVVIAAIAVSCHKEPEKLTKPDYLRYEFGTGEGITGASALKQIAKTFGLKAHYLNDPADYDNLNKVRDEIINEVTAEIIAHAKVNGVDELTRDQIDWYIQKVIKELKESDKETLNRKPKL